jgi:hypothetical protein
MIKWNLLTKNDITGPDPNTTALTYNMVSTKVYSLMPIGNKFIYDSLPTFSASSAMFLGFVKDTAQHLSTYLGHLYVVNQTVLAGIYDTKYSNNGIVLYTAANTLVLRPQVDVIDNLVGSYMTIYDETNSAYLQLDPTASDPTKLSIQATDGVYYILLPATTFPHKGLYDIRVYTPETTNTGNGVDTPVGDTIPEYGRYTYRVNFGLNITEKKSIKLTGSEIAQFAKALGVTTDNVDINNLISMQSSLSQIVGALKG